MFIERAEDSIERAGVTGVALIVEITGCSLTRRKEFFGMRI
jgi:hypothetical protein